MTFLRAGAIYAAANVAAASVPFLLLPILTRILGPTQYGQVVNFALMVTLCLAVSGFSAHAALGVAWFKQPREEMPSLVGAALVLSLASSVAIALAVAALIEFWPNLNSGLSPVWGAIAALTAGANVILQCRLVLWQSQQKATNSALLQVATSILNVGFSLAAVLILGMGGEGRNAGFAVSAVLMAGLAIVQFQLSREVRWSFRYDQVKFIVLFGVPLILHIFAGVLLGTADRWIISIQLGTESLGIYGAGAQVGMAMALLADAFVKAYGPWLYAKLASSEAEDKHYAVGAIYVAAPVFLLIAFLLWIVLHLASGVLLGPLYQDAIRLLPWFMLGGAFTGVYTSISVLFFFSSRTALLSAVTSLTAVVGMTLTWVLVMSFGVDGAAMGYGLTQMLLAVFIGSVAFWSFDLPWRDPGKALKVWIRRTIGPPGEPSIQN
jgi:O-antigen/teichoic acid export membrane protein